MTKPMPHILQRIAETKQIEIGKLLERRSCSELEIDANAACQSDPARPFLAQLTRPGDIHVPNVIAEIKKASPSKGLIRADFDLPALARGYQNGGAAAVSVLTDEQYFQGHLDYLRAVRETTSLPVLRKDFLLHEAQVWEARAAGADAVLLIARMLSRRDLEELYRVARSLGMGILLEVHDEADLEKSLPLQPECIGINNRDLDTFTVDIETTFRLREQIPPGIAVVAESGIDAPAQMRRLADAGVNAVLVGEHLMRQADVTAALQSLRGID